jgi:biopolymer transport protein ExbB
MQTKLVNFFLLGGPFMWPILFLSILCVALIIERSLTALVFHGRTRRFIEFLGARGKVPSSGIPGIDSDVFALTPAEQDRHMNSVFQGIFNRTMRIVDIFSLIVNLAPLLGFIGTVSGMIQAFNAIAQADKVSVKLVASGISEALITTLFGLVVAIPAAFTEHMLRFYYASRAHILEEEVRSFTVGTWVDHENRP